MIMKPKRLIPIFVTAACALGAVPAASAATDVQQATSANWSGYVVGSSSGSQNFTSVSGSWVQPTAKCGSSDSGSYSAFWVGLGGSGQSQTEALEQDGTEADCAADGTPSYFAWYELVPAAPVKVDLAIHPGDHISSKVTVSGQQVTMYLADETTGQSFTKTLQMPNTPDTSSAEWIAEAPSTCGQSASDCTPLPLTDFGKVQFFNACGDLDRRPHRHDLGSGVERRRGVTQSRAGGGRRLRRAVRFDLVRQHRGRDPVGPFVRRLVVLGDVGRRVDLDADQRRLGLRGWLPVTAAVPGTAAAAIPTATAAVATRLQRRWLRLRLRRRRWRLGDRRSRRRGDRDRLVRSAQKRSDARAAVGLCGSIAAFALNAVASRVSVTTRCRSHYCPAVESV